MSKLTETEKVREVKSKVKSMLIIFFTSRGLFTQKIILVGQTVNFTCCCDVLWRLREIVRRLCPELWRQKNWLLHHDNAPSLASFFHQGIFYHKQHDCHPRPPTSPDFDSYDFTPFPRLKIKLKDRHFDAIEVIATESQAVLSTLKEHDFQDAFENGRNVGNYEYARKGTASRAIMGNRSNASF
jgi:hypothetical protein